MYLRRLEQRCMGEKMGDRIDELDTTPPWFVNDLLFCYEGSKHTRNEGEKAALPTTQRKPQYFQGSLQ